jgi:DNA-binding XRE family transcriptional regulator
MWSKGHPSIPGAKGIATVSEPMRDGPADGGESRGKPRKQPRRISQPGEISAPPERIDLSFAVWLARQLRRRHITQRELARRGGLDHSTISRILVGSRAPNWTTVQRIALVVGFPPSNVMLGRFGPRRGDHSASTRRRSDA